MYNTSTNVYIFIIFAITLGFEFLITRLLHVSSALPLGFTSMIYFLFIIYQVLIRINEESEKNKVKNLLYELMDSVNGIPVMNKNEKLIIKWDIVFKKLVDRKEFAIYDKVMKAKTQHIDAYVNKYPSLLMDDEINMREARYNVDLNSTIKGRKKKDEKVEKSEVELVQEEECKKKLFIRDIKEDTAAFSNYDSSIYLDVMINNEYVPKPGDGKNQVNDEDYDGFSVWMAYKNDKYNVVPRVMVHRKRINKTKWFIDNMGALLECATAIIEGDLGKALYVDNYKLVDYLTDMPEEGEASSSLKFKQIKDEMLVFAGLDKENRSITAYCEFKTGYNRFEVVLKQYDTKQGEKLQHIELEKTVAIGNSFQPMITILEKMPQLIRNIELTINNQDISSIVIS